jgi:cell division protein FtsL
MKLLATISVLSLVLLFVWERVDIVRLGYHIEQLKSKKTLLQREQDELRVKVSALTAPDRIARAATEQLGMVPPRQGQVVIVKGEHQAPVDASPVQPGIKLAKSEPVGRMP